MFSGILALLCLAVCAVAADASRYYGYGTGIKGLPLLYADGVAYIGNLPPPNSSLATNITLSRNSSDGSFTAAPTNQTISGNWTSPKLVINNNSGAFAAAEFDASPNTTVTSTGFDHWGTLLVWVSDSGDITTKWYADPVADRDNLWVLKWNVDNVVSDTATPVVLKTLAPVTK